MAEENQSEMLVGLLRMQTELRTYMMDRLTDADLAVTIRGNPSLGEICREHGNVELDYINSLKAGRYVEHSAPNTDPQLAASVEKLKAWYAALDDEMAELILTIPSDELFTRIMPRGFMARSVFSHLHTYREAMLIFLGQSLIHLRLLNIPLNDQWQDWIGA